MDVYADVKEKRKKRRKYSLIFSILVGLYLIILIAGLFLFHSPFFHLKQFEVVGNERVSTENIISLLQARAFEGGWRPLQALLGLRSMLIWPEALSEADLVFMPALKSVTLEKSYGSRTIVVRVEERKPYGIWCLRQAQTNADNTQTDADNSQNNLERQRTSALSQRESASDSCRWFDKEGVLFERAMAAQGGIIMTVHDYSQMKLPLQGKILPDSFISNMFSIFTVLEASDIDRKEIVLDELALEEVNVTTYNGPELYFSLRFPADNDLAAIKDLMAKPGFGKLKYLDFRVENRVYYK